MPDDSWTLLARALLGQAPVAPTGYDMPSALAAGMHSNPLPEDQGRPHWGSRAPDFISPAGIPEGLLLKGEQHPTHRLGVEGERAYGNVLVERNGRVVSVPPWEVLPHEKPLDYAKQLLGGTR